MIALDTNILARFFIDDADDEQSAKQRPAAAAMVAQPGFVSVTVLLEFEWVMRGFYELSKRDIGKVLRALLGIEHIAVEDRNVVLQALETFDAGLDFADSLHHARSARASSFATFDQRLVKRAKALKLFPKVVLCR
jgi:predicted nucleic-acid-binding protein